MSERSSFLLTDYGQMYTQAHMRQIHILIHIMVDKKNIVSFKVTTAAVAATPIAAAAAVLAVSEVTMAITTDFSRTT